VFTCVGWQVTYDPIRQVTLHSCVTGYVTLTVIPYFYLLLLWVSGIIFILELNNYDGYYFHFVYKPNLSRWKQRDKPQWLWQPLANRFSHRSLIAIVLQVTSTGSRVMTDDSQHRIITNKLPLKLTSQTLSDI